MGRAIGASPIAKANWDTAFTANSGIDIDVVSPDDGSIGDSLSF